jgi:hypothetical protein
MAAERRRASALVGRRSGEEQSLQVAVAQAVNGKLAAIDGFKERQIASLEGVQSAYWTTLPARAFLDRGREFPQGCSIIYLRQRGAIAVEGFLGNFRTPM